MKFWQHLPIVGKKSRSMGIFEAASIGVGAMIGAGLFALIGIAAEIAGTQAFLSFGIAGVVALLTTYSVARLSVHYPSKGGRVIFLNKAFGKGIVSGGLNVSMWLGYIIVTALYARAFGEYSLALFSIENHMWIHAFSSGIVIVFLLVNLIGVGAVGSAELITVGIKVLILIVFGILGLIEGEAQNINIKDDFSIKHILLASGVVFMSYEGFGLVANTAEDLKKPKKNLPIALFLSVIVVIAIYMLVSLAVFSNLSVKEIIEAKEYALAEAARPMLGTVGFTVMAVAALFSTTSAINATIYGPVYMLQETAKAGQMPKIFMNDLFKKEAGFALLGTGVMILITVNSLTLESIAETGSLIFLIVYASVNVANLNLREKTESKAWLIWLGIVATTGSFAALLYYLFREGNFSVYLLFAILLCSLLFQLIFQNFMRSK